RRPVQPPRTHRKRRRRRRRPGRGRQPRRRLRPPDPRADPRSPELPAGGELLMLRARRGFTLLEAMTVCAIITILSALAVPSWDRGNGKAKANDAVTGVYGQLLTARKIARTHNQPVRLAMVNDGGVTTARWERLPCDNEVFGIGCPSADCGTSTSCGGSCPCR